MLFDVDIEKMVKLLTVDKTKLISKGIESVKSRVENIKNLIDINQNDFEEKFIEFFENKYNCKREIIDLTNNIEFIKELENNLKQRIKEIHNSKSKTKRIIKIKDVFFDINVVNIEIFVEITLYLSWADMTHR